MEHGSLPCDGVSAGATVGALLRLKAHLEE